VNPAGATRLRTRRSWLLAAGLVVVLALGAIWLGVAGNGREEAGATSSQPTAQSLPRLGRVQAVEDDDVGDPFVLPVTSQTGGVTKTTYVLYWTTDWRSNVPTAVSSDHVHWRRVADSLPVLPSWATPSKTLTWGPTVQKVGADYVLYFSTRDAATGRQCVGRAGAKTPLGPFTDTSSKPLVCQAALGGDIDPSVVKSSSGTLGLLWKNDGNATKTPVSIWEQPLTADGLSVTGKPTRLLGADQAWENGIIEGPAMLAASKGGWWLFFSGAGWGSTRYDTGVAWCATVAGPCRVASTAPLLVSTPTAVSPGGFDTFVDGAGKLWASYSAFPDSPANPRAAMAENRVLEIAPILSH
jgi:beta-xylosidase